MKVFQLKMQILDINGPLAVEDELARLRDLTSRGQLSLFIEDQTDIGKCDDKVLSLPFPHFFRVLPVLMGIPMIPFVLDEFFRWPISQFWEIEISSVVCFLVPILYVFVRNQIYIYHEDKWQEYGMRKYVDILRKKKF
jgi:hypothetical protein